MKNELHQNQITEVPGVQLRCHCEGEAGWEAPYTFNGLEVTRAKGCLVGNPVTFIKTSRQVMPIFVCVTQYSDGKPFLVCVEVREESTGQRGVEVTFPSGLTFKTVISGTRQTIVDYYTKNIFNTGDSDENERMEKASSVKFL